MSRLRNTGIATLGAGLGYVGLDTVAESGGALSGAAGTVQSAIDTTAGGVIDVLSQASNIQIGDLAPLSNLGIQELSQVLSYANISDLVWLGGAGLVGGYLGGKVTSILGNITGTQSDLDNRVGKIGSGAALGLSVIGASAASLTVGSATGGYILGKKISQKIFDEKYAHYIGLASGAAATSIAWGSNGGTIIGSALILGGGKMLWDQVKGTLVK